MMYIYLGDSDRSMTTSTRVVVPGPVPCALCSVLCALSFSSSSLDPDPGRRDVDQRPWQTFRRFARMQGQYGGTPYLLGTQYYKGDDSGPLI